MIEALFHGRGLFFTLKHKKMIARTSSGGMISGRLAEILVRNGRATEIKEKEEAKPDVPVAPKKTAKKPAKKAQKKAKK